MTYPWPYSLPPHIHQQPQPTQPHWIQYPPQASPQPFPTLPPTPPQHPTSHHYPLPTPPPPHAQYIQPHQLQAHFPVQPTAPFDTTQLTQQHPHLTIQPPQSQAHTHPTLPLQSQPQPPSLPPQPHQLHPSPHTTHQTPATPSFQPPPLQAPDVLYHKHDHLIQQQSLHNRWPHQLHHQHLTLQQPHQRLLNLLQHPSPHPHSLRHHTTYHALPSQRHPLHPHSALQEVFGATQIAHHHAHLNITAIQPFQPFPPLHHHKLHPDPGAALAHYALHALHYHDVEAPPHNPWLVLNHNPSLQIDKHHHHQQSPKTKLTLPDKTSLPLPLQNTLQSQLTVLPALHSNPTHISHPNIPPNRHLHHHHQHHHLQFQYNVDLTICLLQNSNHPLIQHNWMSSNGSTATHKHLMSKMNP